nr:hypothetical chloroplast RF21, chloroplastic [Tanacetum cinerariifolium]GEX10104.1 hypothetical chloroplast RF21, chloroplastic [Tanacetum cinerariifolium]
MNRDPDAYGYKWSTGSNNFQEHLRRKPSLLSQSQQKVRGRAIPSFLREGLQSAFIMSSFKKMSAQKSKESCRKKWNSNTPYPAKEIQRISTTSSQENTYQRLSIRRINLPPYAVIRLKNEFSGCNVIFFISYSLKTNFRREEQPPRSSIDHESIKDIVTVLQMPQPDPNNTYIKPPSENQILEFIKTLGYDEDPKTKITDEFEWKTVERSSRPSKMSKLLYRCFTKLMINYILSHNKSIPRRSDSKLHSSQDDQLVTKLLSTTSCDYKFGMEVPDAMISDAMISDAIKKKAGYTYYMAKKVQSKKAKMVDEPEEQHVSLVNNERGKGFMCYGDQVANVPNKLKKYNEWGRKLKGPAVYDPVVQSLLDLQKGSKASKLKSLRKKKQAVAGEGSKENINVIDDVDESNMYLSDDNPHRDDDVARYETLLDEAPANELMDFLSHLVYTDAQTTLVVHNPEGNPKLTSYISGASEQAFDAQNAEPSFHKRSHDNQDSPNNRKGENKKKRQKDVGKPSFRSSQKNKSLVIHAQVDTPTIQPLDQ